MGEQHDERDGARGEAARSETYKSGADVGGAFVDLDGVPRTPPGRRIRHSQIMRQAEADRRAREQRCGSAISGLAKLVIVLLFLVMIALIAWRETHR